MKEIIFMLFIIMSKLIFVLEKIIEVLMMMLIIEIIEVEV